MTKILHCMAQGSLVFYKSAWTLVAPFRPFYCMRWAPSSWPTPPLSIPGPPLSISHLDPHRNKISNCFSQTQFSHVPLRKLYWSLLLITSIPVWVCQKEMFNACFEIHFQNENGQLYNNPFFLIYMCERSASKGISGSYMNGLLLTVNWKKTNFQIISITLLHFMRS